MTTLSPEPLPFGDMALTISTASPADTNEFGLALERLTRAGHVRLSTSAEGDFLRDVRDFLRDVASDPTHDGFDRTRAASLLARIF